MCTLGKKYCSRYLLTKARRCYDMLDGLNKGKGSISNEHYTLSTTVTNVTMLSRGLKIFWGPCEFYGMNLNLHIFEV